MTNNRVSLKNIITPNFSLSAITILACMLLWVADYAGLQLGLTSLSTTATDQTTKLLPTANWLTIYLLSFSFTLLNTFLLSFLNNKYTLIRTRTFLPVLIFLSILSCWSTTHLQLTSHISLSLFILSLLYFLSVYRNANASEGTFMSAFFISLISIYHPNILLLMPVFWIGLTMFQSLSLRTLLASIFGTLAPWILYLSVRYMFTSAPISSDIISIQFGQINMFSTWAWSTLVYISALLIILLMCIGGMHSGFHSDAIHTRSNLNFILLLLVAFLAISYTSGEQHVVYLPHIALLGAIIASHPFTLRQTNFWGILFIIFLVLNMAFRVSRHFTF